MTKSVCIATYNGSKYIAKQLDSVIEQLGEDDEVIIVDDCSTDNTLEILETYSDVRIKLYRNEKNLRHVKSFERAISLSSKDLVFLCDQDDLWEVNRLEIFEDYFLKYPKVMLISSNFRCIDDNGDVIENNLRKVSTEDSFSYIKNIFSVFAGKIGYFGCAMAFKRELISKLLPIPAYVEAHDLWIATAANMLKANLHIDDKTLYHRVHQNNASDLRRNLQGRIKARLGFLKSYFELAKRIKKN